MGRFRGVDSIESKNTHPFLKATMQISFFEKVFSVAKDLKVKYSNFTKET